MLALMALDPNIKTFFDTIWGVIMLFIGYGKDFVMVKDATSGAYTIDPINAMILSTPVLGLVGAALGWFLSLLPKRGRRTT